MLVGFEMIKREDIFNFIKGLLPAGLNYPGGIISFYTYINKNQKNISLLNSAALGSCVQSFQFEIKY